MRLVVQPLPPGAEPPAPHGSRLAFADAVRMAGCVTQRLPADTLYICRRCTAVAAEQCSARAAVAAAARSARLARLDVCRLVGLVTLKRLSAQRVHRLEVALGQGRAGSVKRVVSRALAPHQGQVHAPGSMRSRRRAPGGRQGSRGSRAAAASGPLPNRKQRAQVAPARRGQARPHPAAPAPQPRSPLNNLPTAAQHPPERVLALGQQGLQEGAVALALLAARREVAGVVRVAGGRKVHACGLGARRAAQRGAGRVSRALQAAAKSTPGMRGRPPGDTAGQREQLMKWRASCALQAKSTSADGQQRAPGWGRVAPGPAHQPAGRNIANGIQEPPASWRARSPRGHWSGTICAAITRSERLPQPLGWPA